ncbi:MAG TPA: Gfo/Idh/MocA family oxidoreductase [Propionibacteriaceae bacterium]|nr:Gfo/Idh/MocA family oxidoreductase [Propionibacteriaceae bacterium]
MTEATTAPTKKLRVGVIGLGFIARLKHLPGLAANSDLADVVAFCDFEQDLCDKYQKMYGSADSYTTNDYMDLINDDSIDVIHVLTWNVSHCEITCKALEAGKHVMCEKPMAITGEEARLMVETAKKTGKKLTIGYQNRFREDTLALAKAVDEGSLGEVYVAKAHAIRRRGVPTWGVFTDVEKQGGGPLIDIGTHALDLALYFMDNYEVASVVGNTFHKVSEIPYGDKGSEFDKDNFTTEDSAFGYVKMKNGAVIFLEAAWAINFAPPREASVTLAGTKGGAELVPTATGDYQMILNGVVGGQQVTTTPGAGPGFFGSGGGQGGSFAGNGESKQWLEAIMNDTEPLVKPEQAVVVTEILEAIYKSDKSGQPVYFD